MKTWQRDDYSNRPGSRRWGIWQTAAHQWTMRGLFYLTGKLLDWVHYQALPRKPLKSEAFCGGTKYRKPFPQFIADSLRGWLSLQLNHRLIWEIKVNFGGRYLHEFTNRTYQTKLKSYTCNQPMSKALLFVKSFTKQEFLRFTLRRKPTIPYLRNFAGM